MIGLDINQIAAYLSDNVYIQSLIILIGFFAISKSVVYLFEMILLKLALKTKTRLDDMIVKETGRPVSLLLLFIGVRLALMPLPLREHVALVINDIVSSLIIIFIGYLVIRVIDIIINEWGKVLASKTKSTLDDSILSLLHKTSKIILGIVTFLFVLQVWGIEVGPLLASLGIAGLAVAFALQPTLSNIFGGVSLVLDKSVKKGDIIKLDADTMGTVYDIGIRSTKIKTWDNEIIAIPNGKLVDSKIQNFSLPDPSARINIEFGVAYGSKINVVKKLAVDTALACKHTMRDPEPKVLFLNMGDSALQFKLMFWVADMSVKWDAHQEVISNLYDNLNKKKISIPFPQMDVHLKRK